MNFRLKNLNGYPLWFAAMGFPSNKSVQLGIGVLLAFKKIAFSVTPPAHGFAARIHFQSFGIGITKSS